MSSIRTAAVVATLLLVAGCAATPETRVDTATAEQLLAGPPAPGCARLYIFDGRYIVGTSSTGYNVRFRADDFVDGVRVGRLDGGDMVIVDVPAGSHGLSWQERTPTDIDALPSQMLVVDTVSGQRIFVSNDQWQPPPSFPPVVGLGAIGGALSGVLDATQDKGGGSPVSIMQIRDNGAAMSRGDVVVMPDPAAAAMCRPAR
jgi:hypothetical protein